MTEEGWIDLSERAKFRLSGADRVRYLNGQVTNNVARAGKATAIEACVCNVKGKLEGVISITESGDGEAFLIDAPAALRESLLARLERYLIADDCELEDVTGEFGLFHAIGARPDLPGAAWRTSDRFGVPGWDLWTTAESREKLRRSGPLLPEDEIEAIRIRHGIPAWGTELTPEVFPAEARLDKRAVDFHKGCYLGQEVVSRIQSVGRVKKTLCLLEAEHSPESLQAGWELHSADDRGAGAIGRLTSVLFDKCHDRWVALGYVNTKFADPETPLVTGPVEVTFTVNLKVLPFELSNA